MSGQNDCTLYYNTTNDATTWNTLTIGGSQEPERDKNMRSLYRITVVNPKTEEIYDPVLVVAKSREGALLGADLTDEIRGNSEAFDILVEVVGDVRAKKETQKVQVVEKEE